MIRIAGVERESITDGLGIRYVVFTQGCKHNCEGCHNKATHDFNGGEEVSIDSIIEDIKDSDYLDGVTISGGDPMYQPDKVLKLVRRIKDETGLNIWCFTGFKFEVLMDTNNENIRELLKLIDVIVDGKFEIENKSLGLRFKGSTNQRIIDVQKSLKEKKIIELDM